MYSWYHLTALGAAFAMSSMLLVDIVDAINIVPARSAATKNCILNSISKNMSYH